MSKPNNYKPGNPEYDFWNDKNLYPDLKNDADYATRPTSKAPEDHKTSFGTVFLVTFLWLLFFAPFALLCTWENAIAQTVFWGGIVIILITYAVALFSLLSATMLGIVIILITYAVAFYNALQAEKRKKK